MFDKIWKSKSPQYLWRQHLKKRFHFLEEILAIQFLLISGTTFIRILSFSRRSLNGTTLTQSFGIQKILVFSKTIFLNLLDPPSSFFNCGHLKGIRLITRLCLEFSHLSKHKIKCNFQNCLNPLCSCDSSFECTSYFLLNCPIYNDKRDTIMTTLNDIDSKILESTNSY